MTTPDELSTMMQFALSEMSARNAHHEFEELVRHLFRARIAANVLPATGPVGALGDQGRDLETFRTYLARELGPHGGFLARSTDDTLAVACTLQSDGLPGKIRRDVDTIMSSGSVVDRIYVFAAGPLPVGHRHRLEAEVREAYSVALEVLDLRAIAQELSDTDTFWIATRYLSLPAELAPRPDDNEAAGWYVEQRERWRNDECANTLADFLSIRGGLREATDNPARRSDLPFWLALMRKYLEVGVDEALQQRARYDIARSCLRGMDDLTPADALAAEFIERSREAEDTSVLQDASVLLMYAVEAYQRSVTELTEEALSTWNRQLREQAASLLDRASGSNRRAALLEILGFLHMQPNVLLMDVGTDDPTEGDPTSESEEAEALSHPPVPVTDLLVDADGGMNAWAELVALLDDAPLFPVGRFADYLSVLSPILAGHPLYRQIADGVDTQIERTGGRAAAAGRCRDRAIALLDANNFVAAVHEFHQAKIGWWSGDSVRGSLLAILLIGNCYERIGFLHAAKQHVLLAARLAENSGDPELQDLFAQGICLAAHMDYGLGNWLSSAATAETGLLLHSHFVAALDPDDSRVERMMFELGWIHLAARDLVPPLGDRVKDLLNRAGLWETVSESATTEPRTGEAWLGVIGDQLHGEWMGDLKANTRVSFSGLGTTWNLVGVNQPETRRAIERLAAAAEVLLVELASEDLALLETEIHIDVSVGSTDEARARPVWSNQGRQWEVLLTAWDSSTDDERVVLELLSVLATVLGEASMLPTEEFMRHIESAFERGLRHKIGSGPPLDELLRWTTDEEYELLRHNVSLPPDIERASFKAESAPHLPWQDGPGPTYDALEATDAIRRRYEKAAELIPYTLARLRAHRAFGSTVGELRRRGWLDWHLLNSIVNAASDFRLRMLGLDRHIADDGPRGEEARTAFRMLTTEPETETLAPVPIEAFSVEQLELHRTFGLMTFVQGVGLELHQETPDIPAIEKFLEVRYRYWIDDVEHDDPFA